CRFPGTRHSGERRTDAECHDTGRVTLRNAGAPPSRREGGHLMGCMRRVVALLMLLLLLAGAWLFRDRIRTAGDEWRGNDVEVLRPSPELAAGANRKLATLRDGSARSVSLSAI